MTKTGTQYVKFPKAEYLYLLGMLQATNKIATILSCAPDKLSLSEAGAIREAGEAISQGLELMISTLNKEVLMSMTNG